VVPPGCVVVSPGAVLPLELVVVLAELGGVHPVTGVVVTELDPVVVTVFIVVVPVAEVVLLPLETVVVDTPGLRVVVVVVVVELSVSGVHTACKISTQTHVVELLGLYF